MNQLQRYFLPNNTGRLAIIILALLVALMSMGCGNNDELLIKMERLEDSLADCREELAYTQKAYRTPHDVSEISSSRDSALYIVWAKKHGNVGLRITRHVFYEEAGSYLIKKEITEYGVAMSSEEEGDTTIIYMVRPIQKIAN